MKPINLLWLRRDLRLHDHGALSCALQQEGNIQPVFIFDTDILSRFSQPQDRRLTFIARTLVHLHTILKKRGGGLLVLYGSATRIIPQLAAKLDSVYVVAAEDYEPETRARDQKVGKSLTRCQFTLVKDQVIIAPAEITRKEGPYKVYTAYAKAWNALETPDKTMTYACDDKGRYAPFASVLEMAKQAGLITIDLEKGIEAGLAAIGHRKAELGEWEPTNAYKRLDNFVAHKATSYVMQRDFIAEDGTSKISPYLRFGLISVRECYQKAVACPKWIGELMWREFYAAILYYFPESAHTEWNPAYRGVIEWSHNNKWLEAWKQGKTGYPLVDAAMRQLLNTGWMHNRARMVVASFLTKHLLIDWRLGEEHFAQYLMDYDMASNVGGWQWAASTGTDAQPYFRVFNPYLQSKKFDPKGDYIRRYVPELQGLKGDDIHCPPLLLLPKEYPAPIVRHEEARIRAIEAFRKHPAA